MNNLSRALALIVLISSSLWAQRVTQPGGASSGSSGVSAASTTSPVFCLNALGPCWKVSGGAMVAVTDGAGLTDAPVEASEFRAPPGTPFAMKGEEQVTSYDCGGVPCLVFDSLLHLPTYKNSAGTASATMIFPDTGRTPNQFCTHIINGVCQKAAVVTADLPSNQTLRRIAGYSWSSGGTDAVRGATIPAGTYTGCDEVPFGATITKWKIWGFESGSATFAVKSVADASYTGVSGYSGYTSIVGGGTAPSVSAAALATSANVTSWTTTVAAETMVCFQVVSPTAFTELNIALLGTAQ